VKFGGAVVSNPPRLTPNGNSETRCTQNGDRTAWLIDLICACADLCLRRFVSAHPNHRHEITVNIPANPLASRALCSGGNGSLHEVPSVSFPAQPLVTPPLLLVNKDNRLVARAFLVEFGDLPDLIVKVIIPS
jgi:hypothetical protein